jgi:hypothetical protein
LKGILKLKGIFPNHITSQKKLNQFILELNKTKIEIGEVGEVGEGEVPFFIIYPTHL